MFPIIKSLERKVYVLPTGNYATAMKNKTNEFITDPEKIQQALIFELICFITFTKYWTSLICLTNTFSIIKLLESCAHIHQVMTSETNEFIIASQKNFNNIASALNFWQLDDWLLLAINLQNIKWVLYATAFSKIKQLLNIFNFSQLQSYSNVN